jgi:hypothetical protein
MVRPRILLNHLSSQQAPSDPAYGRTALLPRNHQTTATTTSDSTNHDISFLTSFQLPDLPDRFGADDIASLRNAIDSLDPREASPLPVLLSLILLSFFDGLTNDMSDTSAMALQDPSPGPSTEAPLSFSSGSNEFTGDISSVSRENDLPSAQRFLFLMRTMGHVFLPEDASYEELLRLDSMLGPRLSATTQAAVDEAIPVTMWSESMKTKLVASNECSVCLDTFVVSQPVRVLKCRHVFHRECVDRWLCEFYNNCPVCRRVPVESTI